MASRKTQVMIVEDEALIGFDLADLLSDAGYAVHGPFASATEALRVLDTAHPDLAILDVNLGDGGTSEAVAEALRRAGTPLVFVSGYNLSGSDVLQRFQDAPRIAKPWDPDELLDAVGRFTERAESAA
jgi:DNA-binding response OmpR family regulator